MIATYKEPVPGWINNFYGPTGVVMGAGLGLLRTLHCIDTKVADIIPADYVINNIIVAAWDTDKNWYVYAYMLELKITKVHIHSTLTNLLCSIFREEKQKKIKEKDDEPEKIEDPPIYNSVSSCQKPIDWGTFMQLNEYYGRQVPSALVFWYYAFRLNKHLWVHNLCCFLFHTIPGAIVDFLAMLTGREPM